MSALCDRYLAIKEAEYGSKKIARYESIEHALRHIKAYFGPLYPEQIDRPMVRHYTAFKRKEKHKRGKSYSMATIHKQLCHLNAALNSARKDGLLTADEKPHIDLPKRAVIPVRGRILTEARIKEEVLSLLEHAEQFHILLFIKLAFHTTSRKRPILELKTEQVDLAGKLIYFSAEGEAQTNKRRVTVPINSALYDDLAHACEMSCTGYVLEYQNKPIFNDIKKGFKAVRDEAKLPHITPHLLRHYGACYMAMRGVPMEKLAEYMGDRVDTVRRHYAKYHPDYLKSASDVLGEVA